MTHWPDAITVRAVLDRPNESTLTLARRTHACILGLADYVPKDAWHFATGQRWIGDAQRLATVIGEHVNTAAIGRPSPAHGYSYSLLAQVAQTTVGISVGAGGAHVGRRHPLMRVSCEIINPPGSPADPGLAHEALSAIVMAWDPVFARSSSVDLSRYVVDGGWSAPTGYRVWIRPDAAALRQVPDGVATSPFNGGILISTPQGWSVEQVAAAFRGIYQEPDRTFGAR